MQMSPSSQGMTSPYQASFARTTSKLPNGGSSTIVASLSTSRFQPPTKRPRDPWNKPAALMRASSPAAPGGVAATTRGGDQPRCVDRIARVEIAELAAQRVGGGPAALGHRGVDRRRVGGAPRGLVGPGADDLVDVVPGHRGHISAQRRLAHVHQRRAQVAARVGPVEEQVEERADEPLQRAVQLPDRRVDQHLAHLLEEEVLRVEQELPHVLARLDQAVVPLLDHLRQRRAALIDEADASVDLAADAEAGLVDDAGDHAGQRRLEEDGPLERPLPRHEVQTARTRGRAAGRVSSVAAADDEIEAPARGS
jgi:hypothetical protein